MKRMMILLGMMLASCAAMAATWTDPKTGIEWTYTVSNGKASVGGGSWNSPAISTSTTGAITIPSTLGGYPVTSIGEAAFYYCSGLTSVTIPASVTSIGSSAFSGCSGLTSVTIPSSVTSIGDGAFSGSGLTSVTIPSSVTSIGEYAFWGCSGLKSVTIPSSVTSIGYYAFADCGGLANVVFCGNAPTCGNYVFYHVKGDCMATVYNGTTGWGSSGKWQGLTLKFVDKPITFTAIGYEGVYDGLGRGITVTVTDPAESAVVTYAQMEDGDYVETPILFTNVTDGAQSVYFKITAENYAPTNGVATVTITPKPDGGPYKESVGATEWTFMVSGGKASVTKVNPATDAVTIPSTLGGQSVTSIGGSAFNDCSGLTSVTIPSSVTSIGSYAFEGCGGLTSVTIPASVTYIDNGAFYGCSGLANVLFEGDMPDFGGDNVFTGTPKRMTLTVSEDSIGWNFYEKYSQIPPWGIRSVVVSEDSDEEEESGGGEVIKTEEIHLTVTNVIVHYVTNSKPSDAVIPDYTAGIVNIIAEVDASKAVSISPEWAAQYPTFASTFDSDFSKALMMETGKRDGAGNPMLVWQDYVAGTDPTKEDDVFTASITFDKDTGVPVISWSPELKAAEAAKRTYRKFGKVKLTDAWAEIPSGHEADYNFFKVSVEMK